MIELSKIRLVNWYGFSSMTVPIGAFTLMEYPEGGVVGKAKNTYESYQ